ncbi:hypothetical protein RHECNPAF_1340040 [Rhizobium etli CNPAF512]|nr:hypothetical protein RHECNPAF_1340040 [Rhizobium etli CNPAF512]
MILIPPAGRPSAARRCPRTGRRIWARGSGCPRQVRGAAYKGPSLIERRVGDSASSKTNA